MKNTYKHDQLTLLLIFALMLLACSGGGAFAGATATPSFTPTSASTNTATARPTSTPRPTKTPFPTSAPVGVSINAGDFSYTVVDAVSLMRFYPGGKFLFTANPGYMIVDIGVHLVNSNPGSAVSIPWANVYITEANGDSWLAYYGTAKAVSADTEIDPFTLGISDIELDTTKNIDFNGDAYLRIIFLVGDNDNQDVPLVFGIGDAPDAEFVVKQPK
jgi:glucose/arabinose dehydrogenase